MAIKKKKKKKRGLGGLGRARGGGSSGGGGKKTTPLRPYRNPRTAPCGPGCPIENDARGALAYVGSAEQCGRTYDEAFAEAFQIFAKTNPMPAITGRLCTRCCEKECNRQHKDGSVNINKFERFVGDYAIEHGLGLAKLTDETKDQKVAVVGAGMTGLSCAYHLARQGYGVTVFESASRAGGFLRYIPEFRLPRAVLDAEVQRILDLGVELKTDTAIGGDVTLDQLKGDYDAVFVAVGAHGDRTQPNAPWDAANVLTGIDFLGRLDAGEDVELGSDVVVLGGGNQALDAARAAKRLGANATVVYRREKSDMPGFDYEVEAAEAEGVTIELLAGPVEAIKNDSKAVELVCERLKPGFPDGSGRRRPLPTGETFKLPVSTLILGQIQEPDYLHPLTRMGVDIDADGLFQPRDANKLVHVAIAVGQGKQAAMEIVAKLTGSEVEAGGKREFIYHDKVKMGWYKDAARNDAQQVTPVAERMGGGSMGPEATLGLSQDDAIAEAKRCFSCGMCMDCDTCWMYCQDQAIDKLPKSYPTGEHYEYKHNLCVGCEKCAEECPCQYLIMQ